MASGSRWFEDTSSSVASVDYLRKISVCQSCFLFRGHCSALLEEGGCKVNPELDFLLNTALPEESLCWFSLSGRL